MDEETTSGFAQLWDWCSTAGDEDRSLCCVVPRWTVKIECMLHEFDVLAQRVNGTNHRGLSHFRLDIGFFDGAECTGVRAWHWFVSENTTVRLNVHCKRFHRRGVEFEWANQMVTLFTHMDGRETSMVIAWCGCTVKDIKNLVGLYLRLLRDSEHKDLDHISLTVCHDMCDEDPDVFRELQNEAVRERQLLPTNLLSIVCMYVYVHSQSQYNDVPLVY